MSDLRTLAAAATPGPWRHEKRNVVWAGDDHVGVAVIDYNAAFIAAANPSAVLALLDELADNDEEITHLIESRGKIEAERDQALLDYGNTHAELQATEAERHAALASLGEARALIVEYHLACEATGDEWNLADSEGRDMIEARLSAASDDLHGAARAWLASLPVQEAE